MSQASDILTQFNAGELSPLMEGRVDFAKYKAGCRTLENFVPTVQGPAKRRQGSRFVSTTRNTGSRVWLRPFQASNQEQYVLEFGPHYVRFYTNHGILLDTLGNPYELATPYSGAELTLAEGVCALQMVQSNDVLYIVHASHAPAKLIRTGVGTFTFTTNAVGVSQDGPFKDLNADVTILVSSTGDGCAAAVDGTLTAPSVVLTASTGIFLDGMVGKYFYVQEGFNILIAQWEYNKPITAGMRRRSDSINYVALTSGTTGNVKPVHLSGSRSDGDTGVDWLFTDDGSGAVLIDSLIGAQPTSQVNATVVKRLPVSVTNSVGGATHRWAAAAWTDNDGFPDAICFFRERTVFSRGQSIWMSVAADFENFATTIGGLVTADSAIILTLASDKKDRIQWLQPDSELIAGTASGEFVISEYSNGSPLGPANVRAQRQSAFGSRALRPIAVSAANLFIEKGGRRVREMSFDIRQNQYLSVDVTVLSEHITKATGISPSQRVNGLDGILDWTFALRPDHVVWAARADGVLLGFTYNREQDVTGWHRHKLGYQLNGGVGWGQVESVCAIGSPDGTQEELWLVVKRGDVRHVEWIGQPVQTEILNTPWAPGGELALTAPQLASTALWELDAFYVDGGLSRYPGFAPVRKQVILTAGSTWNTPADWNPHDNTVECIGGGGLGDSGGDGGGGGGGAYSMARNLSLTGTIAYSVSGDAWFNGTSSTSSVLAKAGSSGSSGVGGAGGASSAGRGETKFDGGAGGNGHPGGGGAGGGGGGAGPLGVGGRGGDGMLAGARLGGGGGGANSGLPGAAGDAGGVGGSNGSGVGAGGSGLADGTATAGTADTAFDATHGCGGGEGGGYSGGGAGGGGSGGGWAGPGSGGRPMIVITWTTADVVTHISGLDHLEGLTVQVVTDGSPHPDAVVTGGAIMLNYPAYTVHAGLKAPAILESMQMTSGGPDGSAQGKLKRLTWVVTRMFETKGGYVGPDADHLEQLRYRTGNVPMNSYTPFFTGDERVDWPGGYEAQSRVYVLQDSAFPMTVVALIPTFSVSGRP